MVKKDLLYPELSYEIIGCAFQIFNDIGFGMNEKFYQRAFAAVLKQKNIAFKKEQLVELIYQEQEIGRYFLDFIVEDKIVVELKVKPRMGYVHVKQVMNYLKTTGYQLALLIYFTHDGIKYRRVINIQKK